MSVKVTWRSLRGTIWDLWRNDSGTYPNDQAQLALLQDIRAELQQINQTLGCRNMQDIPVRLRAIERRLAAQTKLLEKAGAR